MQFDPNELIVKVIILLVAFPIHEAAHATMALWLGDDTAKQLGRVTLNPLKHLDFVGTLLLLFPGSFIGWAKPVPYNPLRLRGSRSVGGALISVAGPLSNLVIAALAILIWRLVGLQAVTESTAELLGMFIVINLSLFVFNLIPLPPLDGFGVVSQLAAGPMKETLHRINAQYGFLILFGVILLDRLSGMHLIGRIISDMVGAIFRTLAGI